MAEQTSVAPRSMMEITVEKSDLLRELCIAQGVVERKGTIPILSNFLFETIGGKLLITATDMDLSLRTSCDAAILGPGSCTVPGRKLYDYVRLLRQDRHTYILHWISIFSPI